MGRKSYKAFTLIEMLIVMGILIILMVVGVAAGRFAINRANEIAHQNGANQLYQALQSYFTDNGKFPPIDANLATMTNTGGVLAKYLDMGAFKGGAEADYYYFVNTNHQSVLVCVTLGGLGDITGKGIACVGNGFKDSTLTISGSVTAQNLTEDKYESGSDMHTAILDGANKASWYGKSWDAPANP
jgi:type II secretory pathway pseudopilin PulG